MVALIAKAVSDDFVYAVCSLMDFWYLAQSCIIDEAECSKILSALKGFHDHKEAIIAAGGQCGKKNVIINNWHIPKIEFLQSVVPNIRLNRVAIQWSADTTEHAHIKVVKDPADAANNQRYKPQICCHLDQMDKLHQFDFATSIWEAGIKFCDLSEELEYKSDPDNKTTKLTVNTTSELLKLINSVTPMAGLTMGRLVNYFYRANLLKQGSINVPTPLRTHQSSKYVTFHLSCNPWLQENKHQ
ncbi:hypothetical protein CVT25_007708 [Psilocybe cyanescens]|uniref:Uncharacterized protein n=1 Tax=Psilocybe cyanescens TaxID=93625 RepID=A0A409XVJ7_PSICY|nr:hypothetical protein CVT25_007708 [Psilocybe cyanescens]